MKLSLIIGTLLITYNLNTCSKQKYNSQSRTELLTSKTWIYSEYYTSYSSDGSFLEYKKGANNNALDLTGDWLKFNADGSYSRVDYLGNNKTGTWEWIAEETSVLTTEDGQSRKSKTIKISANKYIWHDSTYSTYGIMIPKE